MLKSSLFPIKNALKYTFLQEHPSPKTGPGYGLADLGFEYIVRYQKTIIAGSAQAELED